MAQSSGPSATDAVVEVGEEWIVYQWGSPSGDGIFLVRPDGTGEHQLAGDVGGSHSFPTWSPDGQRIAFRRNDTELWVVDADGTDAHLVHDCGSCNTLGYPDWTPDGAAITFGFDAGAPGQLPTTFGVRRLDLASGTVSDVLLREDGKTAEQPRLSPDGSQVAYTRYNPILASTGSAIFVSDLAGGEERQLTDWDLWAAYPDWAPDGTIVFNTRNLAEFQDTTEPANLYTVAPDGTDLRQLTTFGDHDTRATQPRWTPDGSGITFTKVDGAGYGVRLMAYLGADGAGMRLLTPEPGTEGTHPELRPVPGP
jgi:Tol biopolymer transport system component